MKRLLLASAALIAPSTADAFGLRTHMYIGERVLADLAEDDSCRISLPPRLTDASPLTAIVPQNVCDAIKAHPGYFLAGTIGPDAFPDPVIGQTYIHPGTKNGLQTADWLERLLAKASTPEEIAFAYGNMLHAAGDVFAHSYVNNYAGDVFALFGRWHKDVELRHSTIERYIDQRLEFEPNPSPAYALRVPYRLLVRANIQTNYVPMGLTIDEDFVFDYIQNPTATLAKLSAEKAAAAAPAAHVRLMRRFIAATARERQIAPCNEADARLTMIEAYKALIVAESKARQETDVSQTKSKPPALPNCIPGKPPQQAGESDEQYYLRLERVREQVRKDAIAQLALIHKYFFELDPPSFETQDDSTNRRTSWWKRVQGPTRRDLKSADEKFQEAGLWWRRAHALNIFSDRWAGDTWYAVERYMDAGRESAVDAMESNRPFPPPQYQHDSMLTHYDRWFSCYRQVFGGKPKEMGIAHCALLKEMDSDLSLSQAMRRTAVGQILRGPLYVWLRFKEDLEELTTDILLGVTKLVSPSLARLVKLGSEPRRLDRDDLDKLFKKGRNGQLTFHCASDWIDADLGMLPQTVHLPEQQRPGYRPDAPCVTRTGSERSTLDPAKFVPLKHALTLSKLALLGADGVARVAGALGSPTNVKNPDHGRYSILLDTVRSIDGSYQWQGFSMPYPRQTAYTGREKLDGAGYPYPPTGLKERSITLNLGSKNIRQSDGFPYYRTDTLRKNVFATLFPEPFEGEILRRAEFNGEHYPFQPCKDDPFRRPGLGLGHQNATPVCYTR